MRDGRSVPNIIPRNARNVRNAAHNAAFFVIRTPIINPGRIPGNSLTTKNIAIAAKVAKNIARVLVSPI